MTASAIEALSLRTAPRAIGGLGALSNRLPARRSNMLRYSLPSSLTEGGIPKQKVPHTFNRDPASAGFLFLAPVAVIRAGLALAEWADISQSRKSRTRSSPLPVAAITYGNRGIRKRPGTR